MIKIGHFLIGIVAVLLVGAIIFFGMTPTGRTAWNNWTHSLSKADEVRYETRRQVEDAARSMIASYNADKLTYEQYRNSESDEKQGWAEQAKMRANRTASSYNEYILKNSYVWRDNVPSDIFMTLEPLNDE